MKNVKNMSPRELAEVVEGLKPETQKQLLDELMKEPEEQGDDDD